MYPRTEYEMTEADMKELLDACKPTPAMFLSGGQPMGGTPQENANRAWATLGNLMGFDGATVQPIQGKGQRFFSAVPNETPEAMKERLAQEAKAKRVNKTLLLIGEIEEREQQLAALLAEDKLEAALGEV